MLASWKESYDRPSQHIKQQRHHFADKGTYTQSYGFSDSHIQMWQLDHQEGWVLKNWCFQTVVLEKTLESPLVSKINPVNPRGNQSWNSLEGLMLKLNHQYFGHLIGRTGSLGNRLMQGKIKGRRQRGRQRWNYWVASSIWWTWVWASSWC